MSEKKCSSQEASFYINDLFDTLEIKGNNQLLFNQFCSVLMKYSLETIKKSWAEIFSSCDLPNGQMAGRLPKMQIIERILFNNRMVNTRIEHQETKKEIAPAGTINSLYKLGMEYHEGKITKQELEKRIDEKFK
tara:strand:- start:30 stop:431 length:402 start_codon:yes stop_codon:yes gene_type:complete